MSASYDVLPPSGLAFTCTIIMNSQIQFWLVAAAGAAWAISWLIWQLDVYQHLGEIIIIQETGAGCQQEAAANSVNRLLRSSTLPKSPAASTMSA